MNFCQINNMNDIWTLNEHRNILLAQKVKFPPECPIAHLHNTRYTILYLGDVYNARKHKHSRLHMQRQTQQIPALEQECDSTQWNQSWQWHSFVRKYWKALGQSLPLGLFFIFNITFGWFIVFFRLDNFVYDVGADDVNLKQRIKDEVW